MPSPALHTFYFVNAAASSSTYGTLQDSGVAPGNATTTTGWTVGTTAATAYANQNYNSKVVAATFGATPQPASAPANAGECWRTPLPLTGKSEAGVWTLGIAVISVTAAASGSGKIRFRIWKSVNANGSSAVELTTSTMVTGAWSALGTGAAQNLVATQTIAATTFTNEYLFIEVACEIDGASASASADVVIRTDAVHSILTAPLDLAYPGDYEETTPWNPPLEGSPSISFKIFNGQKYPGEVELNNVTPPQSTVVLNNLVPNAGTVLNPTDPVSFDVFDSGSPITTLVVSVNYPGLQLYEVVYDGTNFTPHYANLSSISAISHGFHFSIRRAPVWPDGPQLKIYAVAADGGSL